MEKQYEIWCKSQIQGSEEKRMFWCKTIYQKWGEEDTPFKRRARRIFKKYEKENASDQRKFYLIEN